MCVGGEGRAGNHEDSGNDRDNFTIFYSIWDHMTIYMTLLLAGSNKELPANAGDVRDVGLIAGWEYLLEEGTATHSSILAWRMPTTEEPGRLQSIGLQSDMIEVT